MRAPMPKAPARGRSTTIAGDSEERAGCVRARSREAQYLKSAAKRSFAAVNERRRRRPLGGTTRLRRCYWT
jgi:hypothetical protein